MVHQRWGGPLRKPGFHLVNRVVREGCLADRSKEDIGQVISVALVIGADGDFHGANVPVCGWWPSDPVNEVADRLRDTPAADWVPACSSHERRLLLHCSAW